MNRSLAPLDTWKTGKLRQRAPCAVLTEMGKVILTLIEHGLKLSFLSKEILEVKSLCETLELSLNTLLKEITNRNEWDFSESFHFLTTLSK